jgi:undecaprenyl-diphosphatase
MGWDAAFVLAVNRYVVEHQLGWITHLFGVELTYVYALALLAFWFSRDAAHRRRAFTAGIALVIAAGLYYTISHAVGRARPDVAVPGITGFISRVGAIDDPSFPSGHATAGFAIAVGLGVGEPLILIALAFIATLNTLGRIAAGVHYPSDWFGGAVLGSLVAIGVHTARRTVLRIEPFFSRISNRFFRFLPHP